MSFNIYDEVFNSNLFQQKRLVEHPTVKNIRVSAANWLWLYIMLLIVWQQLWKVLICSAMTHWSSSMSSNAVYYYILDFESPRTETLVEVSIIKFYTEKLFFCRFVLGFFANTVYYGGHEKLSC